MADDLEARLTDLALRIDRLKVLYEQYFMGIEKMEPQVARKEVTRVMLGLQQQYIRNTGLRFKFNTMLQKWNIYITYWNRVLREIENGTYVKHLQKAKRKAEREGRELPPEMAFKKVRPPSGAFNLDEETHESKPNFLDHDTGSHRAITEEVEAGLGELGDLEEVWDRIAPSEQGKRPLAARPAAPPPPAPSKPPPLPPPAPSAAQARSSSVATPLPRKPAPPAPMPMPKIPGMTESDLRALHQRYVDAQKQSGAAAGVKYETLVSSLAKQVPDVLNKPGVKGVRFDVTVENGRPVLKAIPQK